MTFRPGQVVTTADWLERHRGHNVVLESEEISCKVMHWYRCCNCNERHLYQMDTIEDHTLPIFED
jgi:hypothetical protein